MAEARARQMKPDREASEAWQYTLQMHKTMRHSKGTLSGDYPRKELEVYPTHSRTRSVWF